MSNDTAELGEVFDLIVAEREYQDFKWGTLEQKNQELAGFLLIMESKLDDARDGWMENKSGRDSVLHEILQVVATGVAALQQYGNHPSVMQGLKHFSMAGMLPNSNTSAGDKP